MKHLLLFTFLTIALTSTAQLNIKSGPTSKTLAECKYMGKRVAELYTYVLPTGDTNYTISFIDAQYTYIENWESFSIVGINEMREFFALVKKMYKEKKGKDEEYTIEVASGGELNVRWSGNTVLVIVKDRYEKYSSFRFHTRILEKLNVL